MTEELMGDFGINAAGLGNLSAFYFYSYVAMQVPTGILADRWGPRRLLAAGAFVASLGTLLFALSGDILWAGTGRLLIGASVAVAFVGPVESCQQLVPATAVRPGIRLSPLHRNRWCCFCRSSIETPDELVQLAQYHRRVGRLHPPYLRRDLVHCSRHPQRKRLRGLSAARESGGRKHAARYHRKYCGSVSVSQHGAFVCHSRWDRRLCTDIFRPLGSARTWPRIIN